MPEPRERLSTAIARIEGPVRWVISVVTAAALSSLPFVLVLWVRLAGGEVGDWPRGTLGALVLLVVLLLPAAWLLNVRTALTSLLALPATIDDVARRRGVQVRRWHAATPVERGSRGGVLDAVRSIRGVVRDYRDVVGSWGLVAQLVAPPFWLLSALAMAAVPVLWLAGLLALAVG